MKKCAYILLFNFVAFLHLYSAGYDQTKIDSIALQLKKSTSDSIIKIGFTGIAEILLTLEEDSAKQKWNDLKEIFTQKDYFNGLGHCSYLMAKELRERGDYFSGYEFYLESLAYHKKSENQRGLAIAHNGLGGLLKDLKHFDDSKEHYLKSAGLYQELSDSIGEASIYLNLGGMYEENNSLESAKIYLKKSEDILKPMEHNYLLNTYINLGIVYFKDSIFDSAYNYFTEAYDIANHEGSVRDQFNTAYFLGKFLFERNRILEARPFLRESENIIQSKANTETIPVKFLVDFTNLLSSFYEGEGDIVKAYSFLKQSLEYEAANKLKEAEVEMYRMDFELAVVESERKQKKHENLIIISFSALMLTLLFLFVMYKGYKQKQKANRLLTEMDELKNRLYSNITHELRTPLTLILGPLEQMLSPDSETTPSYKQIKLMRKNANSLLKLVNQMLDLSKLDAHSLRLELIEQDIVSFIQAHFVAFASMAENKKIEFNYYLPSERKTRLFDADKLEKVINNLISNAIKYTPKNGQVFCFASFPKLNKLELIIQDTGKGIPPEEVNKIFDRFHQIPGSNSSQLGTGIGLSLTKELVELMHGKINVESIVGEGTKFKVQITLGMEHLQADEFIILKESPLTRPLIAPMDTPETNECVNNEENTNNDLPAILIVEDHVEISQFIKDNLVNTYTVESAENGRLGFEQAVETIPDLIISDVMMPEMDGIEMTKKLKADERTSHIPVILLTAQTSHKQKLLGLETGIDAFVPKPFNMKELELRIKKLIEQRQKLREKYTSNLQLEPKDIAVTSADEKFLNRVMEIVEKNLSNPDFETKDFQEELLLSRMQLFRKIKALTNQTPGEFIRTIRLKRAARLMDQKYGNIAQITFEVGFNNPSYFAKCFKELYGVLPSEYIKKG